MFVIRPRFIHPGWVEQTWHFGYQLSVVFKRVRMFFLDISMTSSKFPRGNVVNRT